MYVSSNIPLLVAYAVPPQLYNSFNDRFIKFVGVIFMITYIVKMKFVHHCLMNHKFVRNWFLRSVKRTAFWTQFLAPKIQCTHFKYSCSPKISFINIWYVRFFLKSGIKLRECRSNFMQFKVSTWNCERDGYFLFLKSATTNIRNEWVKVWDLAML